MWEIVLLLILLCIFYVVFKVLAIVGEFIIKILIGALAVYVIYRGVKELFQRTFRKKPSGRVIVKIRKEFV
jgi:predicted neutral ceramidase superfamily lipid hydrolase